MDTSTSKTQTQDLMAVTRYKKRKRQEWLAASGAKNGQEADNSNIKEPTRHTMMQTDGKWWCRITDSISCTPCSCSICISTSIKSKALLHQIQSFSRDQAYSLRYRGVLPRPSKPSFLIALAQGCATHPQHPSGHPKPDPIAPSFR